MTHKVDPQISTEVNEFEALVAEVINSLSKNRIDYCFNNTQLETITLACNSRNINFNFEKFYNEYEPNILEYIELKPFKVKIKKDIYKPKKDENGILIPLSEKQKRINEYAKKNNDKLSNERLHKLLENVPEDMVIYFTTEIFHNLHKTHCRLRNQAIREYKMENNL